jgi:hypothetical protein
LPDKRERKGEKMKERRHVFHPRKMLVPTYFSEDSDIQKYFIGSVTEKVMKEAKYQVLLIRSREE